MLRVVLPLLLSMTFAGQTLAESGNTLYQDLLALEFMKDDFESKTTDTGIDFDSKETIAVGEKTTVSKIHINIEGPFQLPAGTTFAQAMTFNIDSILNTTELNKDYRASNRVADGVGAIKVDVNGQDVGYIEYQVPSMNMAKFRRAVIVKDDKMYVFTLAFFDPGVDMRRGMVFDMLIISAINSGKL